MCFIYWCKLHKKHKICLHDAKSIRLMFCHSKTSTSNFRQRYFLVSTSIQFKICVAEMRSFSFTISSNYIYIICDRTLIATTAQSHYIKEIVLKFVKTRFDDLTIFLFENSNFQLIRTNSSRLFHVIVAYSFASDFIDFSIDFSWKTIVLLEESISRHYNICDNCVASNAIIARAQYIANDIGFQIWNNWNMKISFHYIFCFQRRYNCKSRYQKLSFTKRSRQFIK